MHEGAVGAGGGASAGSGTSVREIRARVAVDHRPLAYTTVETIMDRLTRKGAVARRKQGKAHRYTVLYQRSAARAQEWRRWWSTSSTTPAALCTHTWWASPPTIF